MEINFCPQWVLAKLGVRVDAQPHVGIFVSTLLALVVSPLLIRLPHFCIAQRIFHIPCPGCGILHSMTALLTLNFGRAIHFNPAGIVLAAGLCFQVVVRPIAVVWKNSRPVIARMSFAISRAVLDALAVVWLVRLF